MPMERLRGTVGPYGAGVEATRMGRCARSVLPMECLRGYGSPQQHGPTGWAMGSCE